MITFMDDNIPGSSREDELLSSTMASFSSSSIDKIVIQNVKNK